MIVVQRRWLPRAATLCVNTRRFTKGSLESLCNLEHHTVGEARPKNGDRERHPISSKAGRTRDAREVQNIGIVCKLKIQHQL